MRYLLWFALLTTPISLLAETQPAPQDDPAVIATDDATPDPPPQDSTETDSAPVVEDALPAENLPESAGTLRERKLSEAFEKFVPSETISADNAVPFPVDI